MNAIVEMNKTEDVRSYSIETNEKTFIYNFYFNVIDIDDLLIKKVEKFLNENEFILKKNKLCATDGTPLEKKLHALIGNVFYSYVEEDENVFNFFDSISILDKNFINENFIPNSVINYLLDKNYRENNAKKKLCYAENDFMFFIYQYFRKNFTDKKNFSENHKNGASAMASVIYPFLDIKLKNVVYDILFKNYKLHVMDSSSIKDFMELKEIIYYNDFSKFANSIFKKGYNIYILSNIEFAYFPFPYEILKQLNIIEEKTKTDNSIKYNCTVSYGKYTHENFINFSKNSLEPFINELEGSLEEIQNKIDEFFKEKNNDINKWNILNLKEEDYGYSLKLFNERYNGKIKNVLYINIKKIDN